MFEVYGARADGSVASRQRASYWLGSEFVDDYATLGDQCKPKGGVWVIFPKGMPDLRAETIIPKAKLRGFVDNKIARVSDRLTGMKFVIPVHLRK